MSVVLPLPYIRPFGSKCFAVGLLHVHCSSFRIGGLLELKSPSASAAFLMGASPALCAILCSKHPKGKNPHPARAGPSLTTRTTLLDARKGKIVSRKAAFLDKNRSPFPALFNAILLPFGRFSSADPSAQRWQSG